MKLGRSILGRLLKLRRKQIGLTVYDVGKAIGVSHNAVSYFESGQLGIKVDRLPQLAAALRLDKKDLWAWWLICRSFDDGVDINELSSLAPVFDRIAAVLNWGRSSARPRGPDVGVQQGRIEEARPGDYAELDRDFARSLQTLQRMQRRGDFPTLVTPDNNETVH